MHHHKNLFFYFVISILRINDTSFRDLENCLVFSQARRIKNFTDSLLSFSLSEIKSRCACMRQYVTSNWFFRINMSHCVSRISHDLICHEYSNIELFSKFKKPTEYFPKKLLSFSKLSSSTEITSENSHDWINNQEWMRTFHHESCRKIQQWNEMFNRITSRVFDILKGLLTIKSKTLCNLFNSLWSESSFRINVDNFAISTSFLFWKLSCHAKRMS